MVSLKWFNRMGSNKVKGMEKWIDEVGKRVKSVIGVRFKSITKDQYIIL